MQNPIYVSYSMYSPVPWIPDNVVMSCMLCKETFTTKNRRHHCRNCGHVVCDPCSYKTIALPEVGYANPVRVCNSCHTIIWQYASSLPNLSESLSR